MKLSNLTLQMFALATFFLMGTLVAHAQATRTWVSGVGDDVNPCSRTAPCKTFAGAISKTAAGGEINVLDAGGFGVVTITKSITIDGGGSFASILASLTNGIIINAAAGDHIILRNLSINGAGNGLNGIRYLSAASVSVENCSIFGFAQKGIDVALASSGALMVSNSTIERCSDGVKITTTAGGLFASLDHVYLQNITNNGFTALAGLAVISNSHIIKASNIGIEAMGGATINIDNCLLSNNGVAVSATVATSSIRLSNNSLYNNNLGINALGTVSSAGNNRNAGNINAGAPNGPVITMQ